MDKTGVYLRSERKINGAVRIIQKKFPKTIVLNMY